MAALWPHQSRILADCKRAELSGCKAMVVASATGTGKSRVMYEMVAEAAERGEKMVVYCNRRLLFEQLAAGLTEAGIAWGARAAGHDTRLIESIQLAMIQTERSRVLDGAHRELHDARRVLVDEAHLMANGASLSILGTHRKAGATIIGFTATPIEIGHLYDKLILGAGTIEGRACGALLPARCFGPDMPSSRLIKRVKTGRELIDGEWRDVWLKAIFGRVVDHWRRLNPSKKPTILFAPGVQESRWFAKCLFASGIKAAHIDAKGVWCDGAWHPGESKRQEVLERIANNDLQILCNRFVLREGIDCPELYHCILATRFGSETTFIQAVGRPLRNHHSLPGHVIVQDHGGNFEKFGSPNENRSWELTDTDDAREYGRKKKLESEQLLEPYTCPKCFAKRLSGAVCPECGYVCSQRVRKVVQQDGTLRDVTGKMFKPPKMAGHTHIDLWKRTFWSHYKRGRTFRQALAAFGYKLYENTGTYALPDPSWPFMPLRVSDELRRVRDVPTYDLVPDTGEAHVFLEGGEQAESPDRAQGHAPQGRRSPRPLPLGR